MSWQSALACWFLRRQFHPQTRHSTISAERARKMTAKRAYTPRVPPGWALHEQYREQDWPLRGEWLTRADGQYAATILYLHGGGYYFCSPQTHRAASFGLATRSDARVFSLDYRLAPEHPFPAALDDALAAYRHLLEEGTKPESIVIAGDSAGGGLALATLVALRDAGNSLPAGAVLFSPWTDLAATGASLETNDGIDPMFHGPSVARAAKLYLGGTPATHPYASPLYADLSGLPPLFMQVSSTEVLLDDSRRVADKARTAGVDVDFEIWRKMPHVWQLWVPFIPEAGRSLDLAARFVRRVTGARGNLHPSSETSIA
ncbi:alpha/beta hydrolase fold domain-containing protein [Paraburkholderia sp. CNPSo 3157]|uniref:Alpha/beta hydrolase fold domain-containing protein n=1 Tax=Paraburkholderia franconis TaxID=2654983 RepID=A0A7X1N6U5_9BURK|nr:alpha/beta hydrolase [Paraburkholderia franconis]MPW16058.1 alpha/beta hydrolase fold domain-containing protein [Paraburkholderia franconis]